MNGIEVDYFVWQVEFQYLFVVLVVNDGGFDYVGMDCGDGVEWFFCMEYWFVGMEWVYMVYQYMQFGECVFVVVL